MKRMSAILALTALIAGCSMAGAQKGIAASGQTLIGVGTQFVSVAGMYTQNCKAPAQPSGDVLKFCTGFAGFAPKFQASYPVAVQTWKSAVRANDIAAAQGAEATIMSLATDLSALALQAATSIGGK